jgi:rhodanese-related sulfurtransferase
MLSSFVSIAVAVAALAPGSTRSNIEFTEDTLEVVKKTLASKKAVLVDVRSQEEWDKGHLDGSIFLPIDSLRKHSFDAKKVAKRLPRKKILYTFCVVGMRAKQAGAILEEHGYTVRVLKPGY